MYRIKEAFRAFWAILFHEYYYFVSATVKPNGDWKAGHCYYSDPAEKVKPKFLHLASEMADILARRFDCKLSKQQEN